MTAHICFQNAGAVLLNSASRCGRPWAPQAGFYPRLPLA